MMAKYTHKPITMMHLKIGLTFRPYANALAAFTNRAFPGALSMTTPHTLRSLYLKYTQERLKQVHQSTSANSDDKQLYINKKTTLMAISPLQGIVFIYITLKPKSDTDCHQNRQYSYFSINAKGSSLHV